MKLVIEKTSIYDNDIKIIFNIIKTKSFHQAKCFVKEHYPNLKIGEGGHHIWISNKNNERLAIIYKEINNNKEYLFILIRYISNGKQLNELVSDKKYKIEKWLKDNGYHWSKKINRYVYKIGIGDEFVIHTIEFI